MTSAPKVPGHVFLTIVLLLASLDIAFSQLSSDDSKASDLTRTTTIANATRVNSSPKMDGDVLGDPAYELASPVSGFWQTTPDEGEAASQETEVRVVYTDGTLYFGVICYDEHPDKIIVSDSRRDGSLDETDSFRLILDTYHDKQNGFMFGTNPAGIEYDAQVTKEGEGRFGGGRQQGGSGGGFNINWDGSWEVRTKVSEVGWSAEFAIPFRTLRFSDAETQTWGVNFQRNIRRRNEQSYWIKLPRQFNLQRISLAGSLVGLENISPKNLKVMPYALGSGNRRFRDEDGMPLTGGTQWDSDFGFDVKYSLTPSLTLDATYNTDFAQVEVDEQQINFDRFNLFFPEKRPFFLENAGLFAVGSPGEVDMFFSRRIGIDEDGGLVPILGGLRLTGKASGLNVGFINMQTESVRIDTVQANNFTVGRVTKEWNRSALGALVVNRQGTGDLAPDGDYNRTLAVDGRLGIGTLGLISGFAAKTFTPGTDGSQYAFKVGASYSMESLELSGNYTEVAENFNPEVGFLQRSSFRKLDFRILNRTRPDNLVGLLEARPHVSYEGFWDFNGFQETGRWHIDSHWEWKNGYEIHTGVNLTKEGVKEAFELSEVEVLPGTYDHAEAQIIFFTNRGAWWSFSHRATIGGFFGGDRVSLSPSLRFRVGETFNTQFSLSHNNIDLPGGSFVTNLFQARISYSFTPRIFLQSLIQYNDSADVFSTNLRFGWLQSANTGLFLVYTDVRDVLDRTVETQSRSFIVKYNRLLDLLN